MDKKAQFLHWTNAVIAFVLMILVIIVVNSSATNVSSGTKQNLLAKNSEYVIKNEINQFLNSDLIYFDNNEAHNIKMAELYAIGVSKNEKFNDAKVSTALTFDNQLNKAVSNFFGGSYFQGNTNAGGLGNWKTCSIHEQSNIWILHQVSTGSCETNLKSLKKNNPEFFVSIIGFNSENIMISVIDRRWNP